MSLYSISMDYRNLINAIAEGEIPEEAIADTLDAVQGAWEERAEAVIAAIKNMLAEANAMKSEVDNLSERIKHKKATAERLTVYLKEQMETVGCNKFESARHEVKFSKSKAVVFTNEEDFIKYASEHFPELLRKEEKISPDKVAIKEMLKTSVLPHVAIEERKNIVIK